MGSYGSWLIIYVDLSLSYIYHSSCIISLGTYSPMSCWNISTCLAESKAFLDLWISLCMGYCFISIFLELIVNYLFNLLWIFLVWSHIIIIGMIHLLQSVTEFLVAVTYPECSESYVSKLSACSFLVMLCSRLYVAV